MFRTKFTDHLPASRFHALRLYQLCQLFCHNGFHVSRSSKAITQAQHFHPGRVIKLIVCHRHDKLRDTGFHCLRTSPDAPMVNEYFGMVQQKAERNVIKISNCGRKVGGDLIRVWS